MLIYNIYKMDSSIIKKLRFSIENNSAILNAPEGFVKDFISVSRANNISKTFTGNEDWILAFVRSKMDVDNVASNLINRLNENAILWFSYPKKSSSIETDITRDKGWDSVHNLGWAGVAMISIDATWSAFRVKQLKGTLVSNPTTDASVKAATGKNWKDWKDELNSIGAKELNHKDIVAKLVKDYKMDSWWSQMVTNAYEQFIGRRGKHQMKDGYQVSVSRTFPMPISKAYKLFAEKKLRENWMKDPGIVISTARENKSIRALWVDKKTRISADFYEKGEEKCQVVIQHLKLPNAETCEEMKAYWKENLKRLA